MRQIYDPHFPDIGSRGVPPAILMSACNAFIKLNQRLHKEGYQSHGQGSELLFIFSGLFQKLKSLFLHKINNFGVPWKLLLVLLIFIVNPSITKFEITKKLKSCGT